MKGRKRKDRKGKKLEIRNRKKRERKEDEEILRGKEGQERVRMIEWESMKWREEKESKDREMKTESQWKGRIEKERKEG